MNLNLNCFNKTIFNCVIGLSSELGDLVANVRFHLQCTLDCACLGEYWSLTVFTVTVSH